MTETPIPYHRAPPELRDRVRAALRQAPPARPLWGPSVRWLAGVAAALLLVTSGWLVGSARGRPSSESVAVLDAHLRSLAPGHLADVASTDQHTVKPWFAGKLDFSPPVVDPASAGFPLVAGRVDVIDGKDVAALVYSRRSHIINLFVRPSGSGTIVAPAGSVVRGYDLIHWSDGRMEFWAVSDLNLQELRDFQRLVSTTY
ncbi:MAG TPA: hypothetical protein VFI13_09615 [Gemmatimonadales bacterium]|nr:hypothetical protein [Gemmatimonadales bacterium]